MASFNKVMLMGNLTRDPELRFTANGSAVTSFGLAVNRKFKHGDEWKDDVCFVDITVWGKQGENCAEYLSKGRPAFIEGYLKFSTWESEGQKKNNLENVNAVFLTDGEANGQATVYNGSKGSTDYIERKYDVLYLQFQH